jgi:hypothetical protein
LFGVSRSSTAAAYHGEPAMKTRSLLGSALLVLALAPAALAEDRGDRIDQRLDRRGDRIEQRFDNRAAIADANGHPLRADRLEARGNRIDNRLDRRGDRIDRRFDRRGDR